MESHAPAVVEPDQVKAKLAELGLTVEILQRVVGEAALARAQATPNHPLTAGGTMQWNEGVRSLRDQVIPLGPQWHLDNSQNRGLVVNKKTGVVIGVAGGDEDTGLPQGHPTTSSTHGPTMKEAVEGNQLRFEEFKEYFGALNPRQIKKLGTLWLLLVFVDLEHQQARAELSRPVHWGDLRNKPVAFRPRIVLPPLDLDGHRVELPKPNPDTPQSPEVIVEIKRRA